MAVYIAGSYAARERLRHVRARLQAQGARVVSSWLDSEEEYPDADVAFEASLTDLQELASAQLLILDTLDDTSRGGREVELGWFLSLMNNSFPPRRVVLVGPARNIFHELIPDRFASWDELIDLLAKGMARQA